MTIVVLKAIQRTAVLDSPAEALSDLSCFSPPTSGQGSLLSNVLLGDVWAESKRATVYSPGIALLYGSEGGDLAGQRLGLLQSCGEQKRHRHQPSQCQQRPRHRPGDGRFKKIHSHDEGDARYLSGQQ